MRASSSNKRSNSKAYRLTSLNKKRRFAKVNLENVEKTPPLKRKYRKNFEKFQNLDSKIYSRKIPEDLNLLNLDLHFKDSTITLNLKKPQKRFFNSLILTQKIDFSKNSKKIENGYLPRLFSRKENGEMKSLDNKNFFRMESFKKAAETSLIGSQSFEVVDRISNYRTKKKRKSRIPINLQLEKLNSLITKDKRKKMMKKQRKKQEMLRRKKLKKKRGEKGIQSLDDVLRRGSEVFERGIKNSINVEREKKKQAFFRSRYGNYRNSELFFLNKIENKTLESERKVEPEKKNKNGRQERNSFFVIRRR